MIGSGRSTGREKAAARIVRAHWQAVDGEPEGASASDVATFADEADLREAARVWRDAADLGLHPGYSDLLGEPCWRERWVALLERAGERLRPLAVPAGAAFASLALVVGIFAFGLLPGGAQEAAYATRTAEVRDIALEDGSVVTLGARSALEVELASDSREATLVEGEAFFSVARNPERPFLVRAGGTTIRVLGTKFNVNYSDGRVRVSVLEGSVDVMRGDGRGGRTRVRLTAGQQAVDGEALPTPRLAAPTLIEAGSWRDGRLSYEDATLADIVADANRYRGAKITIASPDLAQVRITTSFAADQIDQMVDSLPDMLPVRVRRYPDGRIRLDSAAG